MSYRRSLLSIGVAALLALSVASPSFAYGKENWQVTFAGTGVNPNAPVVGTNGFGFWGWCAFGGGVTSGNTADCQFSEYVHSSQGGFTCEESIDSTSWSIGPNGDFFINSGTITVHPTNLTQTCLAFFPGPAGLPVDSGVPAHAGHYNIGSIFGAVGEFEMQVTQIS